MYVKPAAGLKVRDPISLRHLPDEGAEVPDTDTYWARKLANKEVVLATPPAPSKE